MINKDDILEIDKIIEEQTTQKILAVIDGVREEALSNPRITEGGFNKITDEMDFMEGLVSLLTDKRYNSPLSTVILGILTMMTQKPDLGKALIEAFNATMVRHIIEDIKHMLKRRDSGLRRN